MPKIALLAISAILLSPNLCPGAIFLETKDIVLSVDSYFRQDVVTWKNVADLDSRNSDDTTTYLGVDYNLSSTLEFKKSGRKFYLKLERNGPTDYDAPLFVHNTLMNSAGVIEKYRNDELLPQVEEFWLDTPLFKGLGFKAGLYMYEVANGFSANGSYENYGFTIYQKLENSLWRIYYCRPDLVYKNHLGPRIRQDEEQGVEYNHNAANFFAADAQFKAGKSTFWPYVGVLADYTSAGKRDNLFAAPIKRDILGTLGMGWSLAQNKFLFNLELAHNFGRAKSADAEYKDVYHTGYLIYAGLDYDTGKLKPSLKFLVCSGNKVTPEMALDAVEELTSGKNRAFSYFSPLNNYLDDSVSGSNCDMRPIVATGAGYGLNYGIPRPETFSSSDFDNLVMPSWGCDYQATDKMWIGFYGYYLRTFARPVGTLNGEGKYLSKELGYEADVFVDYQLNKNLLISILGGYFFPGRYYKSSRDDDTGSLFNPYVRGDGSADCAYQVELAMEFSF